MPDELSIGELARRTARRPSAIRYHEESVRTLAVIDTAQRAGLALDEIKALLASQAGDAPAVEELRRIAERRLPEVDAMIERAQVVRRWLEAAQSCECPSLDDCCLFAAAELPPLERR